MNKAFATFALAVTWFGITSALVGGVAHADARTNDEVFANAALRELHNLAVASEPRPSLSLAACSDRAR
jgi:hypothetical protein